MIWEQSPQPREGEPNQEDGGREARRGDSKCKGPEEGTSLMYVRTAKRPVWLHLETGTESQKGPITRGHEGLGKTRFDSEWKPLYCFYAGTGGTSGLAPRCNGADSLCIFRRSIFSN